MGKDYVEEAKIEFYETLESGYASENDRTPAGFPLKPFPSYWEPWRSSANKGINKGRRLDWKDIDPDNVCVGGKNSSYPTRALSKWHQSAEIKLIEEPNRGLYERMVLSVNPFNEILSRANGSISAPPFYVSSSFFKDDKGFKDISSEYASIAGTLSDRSFHEIYNVKNMLDSNFYPGLKATNFLKHGPGYNAGNCLYFNRMTLGSDVNYIIKETQPEKISERIYYEGPHIVHSLFTNVSIHIYSPFLEKCYFKNSNICIYLSENDYGNTDATLAACVFDNCTVRFMKDYLYSSHRVEINAENNLIHIASCRFINSHVSTDADLSVKLYFPSSVLFNTVIDAKYLNLKKSRIIDYSIPKFEIFTKDEVNQAVEFFS